MESPRDVDHAVRHVAHMHRILGVDLGLKRTGLALSDELGITARAIANLTPRSRAEDVAFLVELCAAEDVGVVVIGLASLPSGDDGAMAKRARGFADALQQALDARAGADPSDRVRVVLVDESGSSKAAAARLVETGIKKGKRKAALDGEVARGLVLEWLASNQKG
jgi:putative Holliday junction resolvase